MGYNIEMSFNVIKNGSVTELLETIRNFAEECFCDNFFEDYEFENKVKFKRNHCLILVIFHKEKINNMIEFLNFIKRTKRLYIELIYDEYNDLILYASQYYITQKMDKFASKNFKIERKKRSYSEDETKIISLFEPSTRLELLR